MPAQKTMRITGGALVRRRFLLPPMVDEGFVRPTPDRVREAVFSMLRDDIVGARVLDLFAGSGAHGFEAVSRGAQMVRFIEKDPRVAVVIKENILALGISAQCAVTVQDALQFVHGFEPDVFDVIFVDPPYTISPDAAFFVALEKHLSPHGVIVFRCFKKDVPSIDERFVIDRDRVYAGTRVFVIRRALTL
jgi:16S rRNA (guanine966-N2)-methyltransferase